MIALDQLPEPVARAVIAHTDALTALVQAIAAVGRRGKSEVDVLVPVHQAMRAGASLPEIRAAAATAADAIVPMQPSNGRASFLGGRSIGHMDPGARSVQTAGSRW